MIWWTFERILVTEVKQKKKHPYFNCSVIIMVWLMLLQSPSMTEKKTKKTPSLLERGQKRRNSVPLMNNLSVDFRVTLWGLNQGVAVMFLRKRGLSGGTTQKRTAVWASCPVELSLYSGPGDTWECAIISTWSVGGNHLSWPLISWHLKTA